MNIAELLELLGRGCTCFPHRLSAKHGLPCRTIDAHLGVPGRFLMYITHMEVLIPLSTPGVV